MITLYFRWLRPMGILFLLCVQERPAFSERVAKEAAVSQATKSQRVRYAALIERAAKLLSAGEFIAAYSAASQAANLNERGYEAPYYCALALYKQDALPSADTYLQKALALVPPEAEKQRQLITTLRKVVADKQTFLDLVKIARADVQAGYIAKAAEEFTAAFTLFPTAQDIGLHCLPRRRSLPDR